MTKDELRFIWECIDEMNRHLPDFFEPEGEKRLEDIMNKLRKEIN